MTGHHLTLYGYEEDGELIVYRCPVCGSSGAEDSHCPHDPPIADGYEKGLNGWVKRVRVRVPRVGEEPRGESIDAFALQKYGEDFDAFCDIYLKDWAALLLAMESDGWRILHFTQQPAGVGADGSASPLEDSLANVSADSDGSQQPLGGEAGESLRKAEGGSVQCDGVALALDEIELAIWRGAKDKEEAPECWPEWLIGAALAVHDLLTQQSSGGQEGDARDNRIAEALYWLEGSDPDAAAAALRDVERRSAPRLHPAHLRLQER